MEDYEASLFRLLRKIGAVSAARGVKTMLVYTPTVLPDEDGRAVTDASPGERECFARLCAENGLVFLDLTERNIAAVEEDGRTRDAQDGVAGGRDLEPARMNSQRGRCRRIAAGSGSPERQSVPGAFDLDVGEADFEGAAWDGKTGGSGPEAFDADGGADGGFGEGDG